MAPILSIAALFALIVSSMWHTGWALVYSLDDPYIHLALARQIQHGSYGINAGEWASPSSSIMWPFLLALVPPAWQEWAPLVLNVIACVLSVHYLSLTLKNSGLPTWIQALATLAVALGLNLFGLVMTGMEHSLQVFLAIFVAQRLTVRRVDNWVFLALGLMPLVRYEGLCLTLPVCAFLWLTREKTRPAVTALISIALVAAFSGFLYSKGLPLLPSSVLAKSDGIQFPASFLANAMVYPGIFAMLAWLFYAYRERLTMFFWCILLPVTGFLVAGRTGWFGRYEVFILSWLAVFLMHSASELEAHLGAQSASHRSGWVAGLMCGALALSAPALMLCTRLTPQACQNIARQQAVMARIAHDLGKPVAVNDLGLVAFRSGQYTLDLWGLGSIEALNARLSGQSNAAWISDIMKRKHVEVAFIYDDWFPQRPDAWIKVAELVLDMPKISAGEAKVQLYASNSTAAEQLRKVMVNLSHDPQLQRLIHVL